MIVVAKIGSSSVTDAGGRVDEGAVTKLCAEVAAVHESGHQVIVVSSGAIAAGQPALGMRDVRRSGARASDLATLVFKVRGRWHSAIDPCSGSDCLC